MDATQGIMKREAGPEANENASARARHWGRLLAEDVRFVLSRHPDSDAEVVRLALIALQSSPLERLNRSLRRGRGFAAFRR
jgi:hypothetical protein